MQNISSQPGILKQVFDMLEIRVKGMSDRERISCLPLEELSPMQSVEYGANTGNLLGNVRQPQHTGYTDHAFIFMLGGIIIHCKQTNAYH